MLYVDAGVLLVERNATPARAGGYTDKRLALGAAGKINTAKGSKRPAVIGGE